ncbi:AAA family ATPase [Campylobacterota bacterium]
MDQNIVFDSALEAQKFAKENPGTIISRVENSNRYTVLTSKHIQQSIFKQKSKLSNFTPQKILNYLNQHIISQEKAKKDIALAMYYHSLKTKYHTKEELGVNGPMMIVGSTGSGKTFIVQKACEYMDTVFIHVDASSMVPEGIQGYSISVLGKEILAKANYNIHRASHCVVFFDEIDKLFNSEDKSEFGGKVANQLLRLIEGSTIKVSGSSIKELDTSNIQFILGGAFQWILDEKSTRRSAVGFTSEAKEKDCFEITLEDLFKEGIPKELLGRMSTIVNLQKLSEDHYFSILTNSKSSPLKEFVSKVEFHGDSVDISEETLRQVSKVAAENKLGVRAIKQILTRMFSDALFYAADEEQKTHTVTYKEHMT